MGPLNTFEYQMDDVNEDEYRNDLWQNNSRLSWYCSEDFDETRLPSAFSEMGLAEESDEGRLSRALQSWMPDYVITSVEPMEKPPYEPVFTGKLGKDRDKLTRIEFDKPKRVPSAIKRSKSLLGDSHLQSKLNGKPSNRRSVISRNKLSRSVSDIKTVKKPFVKVRDDIGKLKRTSSDDSISTHYSSLFELSSLEAKSDVSTGSQRSKRRSRNRQSDPKSPKEFHSRWIELASRNKTKGAFDKYMRLQNVLQIDTYVYEGDFESELYELLEPDERRMMMNCARKTGIRLNKEMKKSKSMTNINDMEYTIKPLKKMRVLSAGRKPLSKGFNLQEARQRLEKERQAKARLEQESKHVGRRRSRFSQSARSDVSSNLSVNNPSVISLAPSTVAETRHETVWKGDKEILEMDLKRGLTTRVQKRIKSTTTALERATGHGESNRFQRRVGRCEDFPQLIEDDYGLKPKIAQRMRISPFLSNVIRTDIKVRMGRPRYHEIRTKDLDWWTRGQKLDRSHRNLKVFNWLHSLREDEFEHLMDIDVLDKPPESRDDIIEMHVEAADEPDLKPLYLTDFFK